VANIKASMESGRSTLDAGKLLLQPSRRVLVVAGAGAGLGAGVGPGVGVGVPVVGGASGCSAVSPAAVARHQTSFHAEAPLDRHTRSNPAPIWSAQNEGGFPWYVLQSRHCFPARVWMRAVHDST
jgi:hypothetical protein